MREERANTARIGFFGDNYEFEVYVVTDDHIQVPHFHIRPYDDEAEEICVELFSNHYLPHERDKDIRWYDYPERQKALADFMAQPCRCPRFANNYEFTAVMWNTQNYIEFICETNSDGEIIIPDYTNMNVNIDRELFVLRDGGFEGFDDFYINYQRERMNKRTWK